MKRSELKKVIRNYWGKSLFTLLFIGICLISNGMDVRAEYKKVEESELPLSTMEVYRDMDTTFLGTFPYGTTYEGEIFLELKTATEMMEATDVRLKEGRVVQTAGFYEAGDLGGATYMLSTKKATGGIALKNGLYANIIMDTKVIDGQKWGIINPKQLGAKADGENAENSMINDAINIAGDLVKNDESVFRSIMYLPSGEYKCTNEIWLNVANINMVGDGNETIIFTDNDYRKEYGYSEFFFSVSGAKDVYMADFYVEAREINGYKYMRQMVFTYCDNVYTYRVNLNIPQEAFSKDYFVDKQYTSLTYYSGNKNMTLDNCKLELMCSTYRGANIGVLDFWSSGEENITIMNCELHSDARDEQVGIFTPSFATEKSYIKNIHFVNNTMYSYQPLDKTAAGGHRHMCFTVAYNDSVRTSDIFIRGNHFIADLDSKHMTFGNGLQNGVVENNMFELRCTQNGGSFVFDSSASNNEQVLIQDNEFYITYRDSKGTGKASILGGKGTVRGNKFVSDTFLGSMGYKEGICENNTYINLGQLDTLDLQLKAYNNNKVISYGQLGSLMLHTMGGDVIDFNGNSIENYQRIYQKMTGHEYAIRVQEKITELNVLNNTFAAPNSYYWTSDTTKEAGYIKGLYFRTTQNGTNTVYNTINKVNLKNNIMQGTIPYYTWGPTVHENVGDASVEAGQMEVDDNNVNLFTADNEYPDYTLDPNKPVCTSIEITKDGVPQTQIFTTDSTVTLGTIVKAGILDENGECSNETVVTDKEIVWYTSLDGMATVENGVVTRKNYGKVDVFAVSKDGVQDDKTAVLGKCSIYFVKDFATDITFEKDSLTLQPSKKYKVVYEVVPADKVSQKVEWVSSNPEVATVNSLGIIEAISVGETDITCITQDGTNLTGTVHVKVEPLTVKKITLNQSDWYDYEQDKGVNIGDTLELEVQSYTPDDATNKGIKRWESSDESVATVDENGKVTAVGGGCCVISAYSLDETCNGSCKVWVQPDKIPLEDVTVYYTDSMVRLTWEKINEAVDGYIIYCDKGDGNGYQNVSEINGTQYTAYGVNVGQYIEAGKTYKYKIAPFIRRTDSSYNKHTYETPTDEIIFKTYANSVITSFNTSGKENLATTVGGSDDIKVYIKSPLTKEDIFYSSSDETIFTIEDKNPSDYNYDLRVVGQKEGLAYFVLKANDELGYEKKYPVLVYDFPKVSTNIEAEALIKSVSVKWKVEDTARQDGFKFTYRANRVNTDVLIPMDEIVLTTDENGDTYATYMVSNLLSDTDYEVWVAPYKNVDEVVFAGPASSKMTVHTPEYVNVDTITADHLHLLKVGESKKITAEVGPEDASEPNLMWIPYNSSIIQATETGKEDENIRYAMIKGLKPGITRLNIVANDENNYQVEVKAAVVPQKVTNVEGIADNDSASLSWSLVEGAAGYAVYRYDENQDTWTNIAKGTENSYEDSGLSRDTLYKYKISAYVSDADGIYESDYTDIIELRTLDKLPVNLKNGTEITLKNSILTYGESLSKLEFNHAEFVDRDGKVVEGTLAWKNKKTIPNAGTTSATWIFTPSDDLYETLNGNIAITVNKATPYIVTKPSATAILCGNTLGDAALTGGTVQYSSEDTTVVAGSFAWKNPSVKVTVVDSNSTSYTVVFIPEDETNYNSVECNITLEVKEHSYGEWTTVTEATCMQKGDKKRICLACAHEDISEIPATKDITNCAVNGIEPSYTYSGKEIKPEITLMDGNIKVPKEAYTVGYVDNINAGTATVTVSGTGEYTGTITKTFVIYKTSEDTTTENPTEDPTEEPTTEKPTENPTEEPTTEKPTENPTEEPTTENPTENPTEEPTTEKPTENPTEEPTTEKPTENPTEEPTTENPTKEPTTENPTENPTEEPTMENPTTEQSTEEAAEEKQILEQKNDKDIKGSTFGKLCLRMYKVTKNSIKLKWNKVKGADGYVLYGSRCNSKGKIYKLEKLSDTKKLSYTHKKLKKGTFYKYVVRAYQIVNGAKKTIATSKTLHITTSGGKYANYTSIKVPKTKVTIKKGSKYTIKAKVVLPKGKKSKTHKKLAYESSNKKIATVTSKGVIKAKKKGTCYIYVYAQNGVYKKITVKVK